MSDVPSKIDPEDLGLRVPPKPVTRINRRVLMILIGTGSLLVLGATIVALDPPHLFDHNETAPELYNIANKQVPEGLAVLPPRYSDIPHQVIELGSPLPGDLGGAVLDLEQELGIGARALPFRPNPEDDALRAERIRQARMAQQAGESQVFFQLTQRDAGQDQEHINAPISVPSDVLDTGADANRQSSVGIPGNQNPQDRKLEFLNRQIDPALYNRSLLQDPVSPYQVMAGTVIAASLITGINSDLPGQVVAQITQHVYDTVTGQFLLIPQGSRLIGVYDSVIAFGQERALIVWQRIIMPDGASIVIENLPAMDTAGYAGLGDEVDFHTWRLLKGIALSTLLGVGAELSFGAEENDLVTALRESTQDSTNKVGQRITERNLGIQPTITIRPGWPLRVIVNKDLVLRAYLMPGEK